MTPPKSDLPTARIASLTLVNAMIFHQVAAQVDARITPLDRSLRSKDVVAALEKAWTMILEEIDYVPIFSLAREILRELTGTAGIDDALKRLGETAQRITGKRAALRHDLMGRIYHRLLSDAKFYGAYYTSIPAATLLLKLAITPARWPIDFADADAVRGLRIADFACGTGTLLKAASQVITDNHIRARAAAGKEPDLRTVHKSLVEAALWGFDVIPFAIHLAGSALALHEPDITFGEMNLRTMPLGVDVHTPYLGSLDFISGSEANVQADLFGGAEEGPTQLTGTGEKTKRVNVPMLDLCVMNPPFVRSVGGNLLFGSLPERQRAVLQKALKKLVAERNVAANITAGLAPVFAAMGHSFVKPGGYLALVVPRALLSGVAWGHTRTLLAQNYHVEYVVVSHEPGHWNFSENTKLSECLVVARRLTGADIPGETKFVNLSQRPANSIEALSYAAKIQSLSGAALSDTGVEALRVGEKVFGELIRVPAVEMKNEAWGEPAAFAHTDLCRVAFHLRHGNVYAPGKGIVGSFATKKLGSIGEIGPDRRDIHDGFSLSRAKTAYPAFWGHETAVVQQMAVQPNQYLTPLNRAKKGRNLRDPHLLRSRAGGVLIAERLRLDTARVISLRCSEKVLSNTWWPFKVAGGGEGPEVEKALVVWLNSTFGIISVVSARVDTEGRWIDLKKPILSELIVPDLVGGSKEVSHKLAATFDQLSASNMLRLTEVLEDSARSALDRAVAEALGVTADMTVLRTLLADDPLFAGESGV